MSARSVLLLAPASRRYQISPNAQACAASDSPAAAALAAALSHTPPPPSHHTHRWASAGAFYPFSRNHFSYNSRSHEYYRWPDVAAAAKKAFTLRYKLMTYMYSGIYLAHSRGGTLARAVLFTDPSDTGARCVSVGGCLCQFELVACWGCSTSWQQSSLSGVGFWTARCAKASCCGCFTTCQCCWWLLPCT